MVEKQILPYPFPKEGGTLCGGAVEILHEHTSWVRCTDCSVEGPSCRDESTAISRWNALARAVEVARLAKEVAVYGWGTSVSETYHHLRMYHMDALRAAIQQQERGE